MHYTSLYHVYNHNLLSILVNKQNVDTTLYLIDILPFLLTAHGTSDPSRPFCGVLKKELESHGQAPLKSGDKSGVCLCEHVLLKFKYIYIYGTLETR